MITAARWRKKPLGSRGSPSRCAACVGAGPYIKDVMGYSVQSTKNLTDVRRGMVRFQDIGLITVRLCRSGEHRHTGVLVTGLPWRRCYRSVPGRSNECLLRDIDIGRMDCIDTNPKMVRVSMVRIAIVACSIQV